MKYYVQEGENGVIIKVGSADNKTFETIKKQEGIIETTKIMKPSHYKVVDGEVVEKTLEEIETTNPLLQKTLVKQKMAFITNEQLQDILKRLTVLER